MSPEVDARTDSLFYEQPPEQPGKEAVTPCNEKEINNGPSYQLINTVPPMALPARSPSKKLPIVLGLSVALAIMTILAIVAAAVGGSTAVKRQNDISHLREQLRNNTEAYRKYITDSANSSNTNTSNANPVPNHQPAKLSDVKPTDNCTAIGDKEIYVAAFTKMRFTVHCETDYPGSDMLGIWVFTFADCMEACASWNDHKNTPSCHAVTYNYGDDFTEESGFGNCFLKDNGDVPARFYNVSSSAQAQFSGAKKD
ncbi:MAG: hypothetical protein Q9213_000346 [Squamulea squamosa]